MARSLCKCCLHAATRCVYLGRTQPSQQHGRHMHLDAFLEASPCQLREKVLRQPSMEVSEVVRVGLDDSLHTLEASLLPISGEQSLHHLLLTKKKKLTSQQVNKSSARRSRFITIIQSFVVATLQCSREYIYGGTAVVAPPRPR